MSVPVARAEGYAAISDYAIVGDGRTAALVARDGSIDWLCLPDLDSGSVFGALLDADRGGAFRLAPVGPYAAERRYVPDTNVLETTFTTAGGSVRITDAMVLADDALAPSRELVRHIEGLSGRVELRWSVEPRFGYAEGRTRIGSRGGVPVATNGSDALAVLAFGAGDTRVERGAIDGAFVARSGSSGLLALAFARGEPLVFPAREHIERRLQGTIDHWRGWVATRRYDGPWRDAVLRSALALKLLIHAPSGAIAAAVTTSLPEEIGGVRNWDYRYCWVRDSSATLDALERLGCPAESQAFFWWLRHASQLTHPRVRVLYRLNGRDEAPERELALAGYKRSRPVRIGNAAAPQLQLDVYGHLLQTAWLHAEAGGRLDRGAAARLAATADLVSTSWSEPDSGIWEVRSAPQHFTESKMMCWIALDRASRLAEHGHIPQTGIGRWRREADAIRRFVSERCWSESARSYERFPGAGEVDAALLLPALLGYGGGKETDRLRATVARIRADLGAGPLLHRYRGDDGIRGDEGAFLTCSFWLVDALARLGQAEEAAELMEQLLDLGNDVGLYAEEIEPHDNGFLGNFPQGLVHLALVNAAATLAEVRRWRSGARWRAASPGRSSSPPGCARPRRCG
ncbi:MAG TPA: glycoside hydrolase family 15 protein [Solirubrobacteraceae bacterium]|nr:glycoside hydrolase family 15 protein [Solirubrobacteraceae bacterium]